MSAIGPLAKKDRKDRYDDRFPGRLDPGPPGPCKHFCTGAKEYCVAVKQTLEKVTEGEVLEVSLKAPCTKCCACARRRQPCFGCKQHQDSTAEAFLARSARSRGLITNFAHGVGRPCPHFHKEDFFCQQTNSLMCCPCLAKHNEIVQDKENSKTTTLHFCGGCEGYRKGQELVRQFESRLSFKKWEKNFKADPRRTVLATNFYLRSCGLPFEITHMVLSFTVKDPPVNFFRFFDRPELLSEERILDAVEASSYNAPTLQTRERAAVRTSCCDHSYCSRKELGCCACADARPNKMVDCKFVDGKGMVVRKVDFFAHYCSECQYHWRENPDQNPHD